MTRAWLSALGLLLALSAFASDRGLLAIASVLALGTWVGIVRRVGWITVGGLALLAAGAFFLPASAFDLRAWALSVGIVVAIEAARRGRGQDAPRAWVLPGALLLGIALVLLAKIWILPIRYSLGRPESSLIVVLVYGAIAAVIGLWSISQVDDEPGAES